MISRSVGPSQLDTKPEIAGINAMLKIADPTTVPTPRSNCPVTDVTMTLNSSGIDDPTATITDPCTSGGRS
jgi:hypothetical protein